jgi:hypothetical protein
VGFVAEMRYEERQEFHEPMAVVAGMSSSCSIAAPRRLRSIHSAKRRKSQAIPTFDLAQLLSLIHADYPSFLCQHVGCAAG